jgi:hypothetical protein
MGSAGESSATSRRVEARAWIVISVAALVCGLAVWGWRWRPTGSDDVLLFSAFISGYAPLLIGVNIPALIHLHRLSRRADVCRWGCLRLCLLAAPLVLVLGVATWSQFDLYGWTPGPNGSDIREFRPRFDFEEWYPAALSTIPSLLGLLRVWPRQTAP